jgi:hypothetical protein
MGWDGIELAEMCFSCLSIFLFGAYLPCLSNQEQQKDFPKRVTK